MYLSDDPSSTLIPFFSGLEGGAYQFGAGGRGQFAIPKELPLANLSRRTESAMVPLAAVVKHFAQGLSMKETGQMFKK